MKTCKYCGRPPRTEQGTVCLECTLNWNNNSGRTRAGKIVNDAKKAGALPDLKKVYIPCEDCNKRATDYDHRDYNYPLLVNTVCHSCNVKRGKAIPHVNYKPIQPVAQ